MKLFLSLLLLHLATAETDMPTIGILAIESYAVDKYFPGETFDSYIAAQDVKFVEGFGARAVPVWIGKDKEYYKKIVESTNGLLWPGGATYFNETNGYAVAGKILYDLAIEANANGDYYPIFGICLGLELLMHLANDQQELRKDCSAIKMALPLNFKPDYRSSKLFRKASKEVIAILKHKNVTYNYHRYCITEESLQLLGLTKDWKIISTNYDVNGLEFISAIEHNKYPFYGIQFHPEKNIYVHKNIKLNIPHTFDAVMSAQHFTNFFITEARKNSHTFPSWSDEQEALIYNFNTRFVIMSEGSSEQLYMFK